MNAETRLRALLARLIAVLDGAMGTMIQKEGLDEAAYRGATREITLRSPQLDASGHVVLKERTLSVRIPPGVRPGQMIRLAGQGGAGPGGSPAGDMFLDVAIAPHPRFRVDGATLITELPLAPWEAALGTVVPIEMPDGQSIKVRVPGGAQAGRVLTVRGSGFCHVPHNAVAPEPLWGQALSRVPSYAGPQLRRGKVAVPAPQPEGASRLCLSCHDRTVALGDLGPRSVASSPWPAPSASRGEGGASSAPT